MSESSPHLVVRGVSKRYGPTTVLDHIDLTIRRGELVTLLGPSGCGKTTLLRAIAGLAQPDAGKVELAGRDITDVPPHSTVVGNPGHPVRVDGRRVEGPDADWIHLPDPIADAIEGLASRIGALERAVAELSQEHPEPVAEVRPLRRARGPNPAGG